MRRPEGSQQKPDSNRQTSRHTVIRTMKAKDRDRILKTTRSKKEVCKGKLIRLIEDLSNETNKQTNKTPQLNEMKS